MAINIPAKKSKPNSFNPIRKNRRFKPKKNKDKELKIVQTKPIYVPLSRLKRHYKGDDKKLGTVPK